MIPKIDNKFVKINDNIIGIEEELIEETQFGSSERAKELEKQITKELHSKMKKSQEAELTINIENNIKSSKKAEKANSSFPRKNKNNKFSLLYIKE